MERLSSHRFAFALFLLTGIFIGLLIGTAVVTTFIGQKLDNSHEQISYLQAEVNEKDVRLGKLEDSINTRKFIIRKIEVSLQFEGDKIEKTGLEKYVKDRYFSLLGKEVTTVDTDLVLEIMDNRIVHVNGIDYKITIQKIVLSDVLKIWVTAASLTK